MFFFRSFVVWQSRKASLGNEFVLRFRKLPVEKSLLDKLGRGLGKEGVSRFSVEFFVSRSTERLHWATLLCCVSEKYRSRKNLLIRWEGVGERGSITVFCQN